MNVTVVGTALPAYRQPVFDLLAERLPGQLTVVSGIEYFDPTVQLAIEHPDLRVARNHYLGGRRVLWQSGALKPAFAADVAVIELNPRILSGWAILLARRARRRRTLVWGHAWPRGGKTKSTDRVRQLMRQLASGIIVYTHLQAAELRRRMPGASITAAPNALYSRLAPVSPRSSRTATDVLYIGRLVETKKPQLLLDAFVSVIDRLPPSMNLVFVGEGPSDQELAAAASEAGIDGRIRFLGQVTAYDELQTIFANTLVTVCPGYAGLSITQSYWFGVPTIIGRGEDHSPEIEAAIEDENTLYFESDSVADLGRSLVEVVTERDAWLARGEAISGACSEQYSMETMIDALISALEGAAGPEQVAK